MISDVGDGGPAEILLASRRCKRATAFHRRDRCAGRSARRADAVAGDDRCADRGTPRDRQRLGTVGRPESSRAASTRTTSRVVVHVDAAHRPRARRGTQAIAVPIGWTRSRSSPSAPAVGDVDHDGDDEIVIATPDGNVFVFDMSATTVDARDRYVARVLPLCARARGCRRRRHAGDRDLGRGEHVPLEVERAPDARVAARDPRRIAGEAPAIKPHRELESPLIADIDGDNGPDVLFPLDDGTLAAFHAPTEAAVASFPRPAPARRGAAPRSRAHAGSRRAS